MTREADAPAAASRRAGAGDKPPADKPPVDHSRTAEPFWVYEEKMQARNEQLREKNMGQLQRVELLAARLYTGPMVIRPAAARPLPPAAPKGEGSLSPAAPRTHARNH